MSDEEIERPPPPVHGRGAVRNVPGRFERFAVVPVDDGPSTGRDDEPAPLETTLTPERARSILTENDSPDVPFSLSINPYRGCEHGCSYCFARASHAWLGLSPGLDFESRLFYKPDAPVLLRRELARRGHVPSPVALGANTDPYQPVERRLGLTRSILEVLAETCHPVTVVTKSRLVLRDLDLLAPMAARGLAAVAVSVTTLDPELARAMEPRATSPALRLATLERLAAHGVPTTVLVSPVIPGLTDAELERILGAAAAAGVRRAAYLVLRLPHEVQPVFVEWLRARYPGKAGRVLHLLRELRGGELSGSRFHERHTGRGVHADLLRRRFEIACRRLGLDRDGPSLDSSRFRPPRTVDGQGRLFD